MHSPNVSTFCDRLQHANLVLESSVESLRSGMQEKLEPLLAKIALLEDEKCAVEEEMAQRLACREATIQTLESLLAQTKRASDPIE